MQKPIAKAYMLVSDDPNKIQKISAYSAKSLSSLVRTCLGPRAMQKMVLTKINSIELTTDGNSILREIDVNHPSARCLIELSQTQDDECGDGTTSVLILASELLGKTVTLLKNNHPIKLCKILAEIKNLCLSKLTEISIEPKEDEILNIVMASVATKLSSVLKIPIPEMALRAISSIKHTKDDSIKFDINNHVKVMKIFGSFDETEIIDGVLLEKDMIHSQMRTSIDNPKVLILDSSLEYKKGEGVTNMELNEAQSFTRALEIEEEQIRAMCNSIISTGTDIVVTEKGISDLALSILYENNITAIRRVKKSDCLRIAKATRATIVNRIEDVALKHLGQAGILEYIKIGKNYFFKLGKCTDPGVVTVLIRGPSKDLMVELERNFFDALKVAKNLLMNPRVAPGAGASEIVCSLLLKKIAETVDNSEKPIYIAASNALKSIPAILASNSGTENALEILSKLEDKQNESPYFGVNGITGEIVDVRNLVMEPLIVKLQCVKSAFEAVMQLLRVDGIIESKSQ